MNWLSVYLKKIKYYHIAAWGILLFTAALISFLWLIYELGIDWDDNALLYVSLGIGFLGLVSFILLLSCKVVWRKYNDHYFCLFMTPTRNYFIIDNELQCEGGWFQYDYYGQLPDGTSVTVKVSSLTGSVKFAVGDFNNYNIAFF